MVQWFVRSTLRHMGSVRTPLCHVFLSFLGYFFPRTIKIRITRFTHKWSTSSMVSMYARLPSKYQVLVFFVLKNIILLYFMTINYCHCAIVTETMQSILWRQLWQRHSLVINSCHPVNSRQIVYDRYVLCHQVIVTEAQICCSVGTHINQSESQ